MAGFRFTLKLTPHGHLFRLRKVDEKELLANATAGLPVSRRKPGAGKVLDTADICGIFGLDLEDGPAPEPAEAASRKNARKPRVIKPRRKKNRKRLLISPAGKRNL